MCNLAQHIAKVARLTHPSEPIPADIRPVSVQMGALASSLAEDAAAAIESRDPISAAWLMRADDEVDALRRRIFEILFSEDWSHGAEPAVNATSASPITQLRSRAKSIWDRLGCSHQLIADEV